MLNRILENVKNMPSEFRAAPFWAWNTKLSPDELRRQIKIFDEMGLGGFFMHVRVQRAKQNLRARQNLRAKQNLKAKQNLRARQSQKAKQNLRARQSQKAKQNLRVKQSLQTK